MITKTEIQAIFDKIMSQEDKANSGIRLYKSVKDFIQALEVLVDVSRLPSSIQTRLTDIKAIACLFEEANFDEIKASKSPIKQPRNRIAVKRNKTLGIVK